MRHLLSALVGLLLLGTVASAQQPTQAPPPQPLDPAHNRLDALLLQWEGKMKDVTSLSAQITRVKEDKTFRSRDVFDGTFLYLKPNMALLDLRLRGNPLNYEKIIVSGTYLYEFRPDEKVIRFREMPASKPGQMADDNFLSFLIGIKAVEAKRRYDLRLAGEDTNYIYVEILPITAEDRADFQKAQLVLNQSSYLPRMLTFTEPNGNKVTWDIPKMVSGLPLNRNEFMKPTLPPTWKFLRMPSEPATRPADVPPRVVRPQK